MSASTSLERGDVLTDNRDRVCVAVRVEERPSASWIRDQEDRRVRDVQLGERWWLAWPISGGGAVLVPERALITTPVQSTGTAPA